MTFLGNDFEIMLDHTYTTEKYIYIKKKQKQYLQALIFVFNAAMRKKSS